MAGETNMYARFQIYGRKDEEGGLHSPKVWGNDREFFISKDYTLPPEVCDPYNKCSPSNIHVPLKKN